MGGRLPFSLQIISRPLLKIDIARAQRGLKLKSLPQQPIQRGRGGQHGAHDEDHPPGEVDAELLHIDADLTAKLAHLTAKFGAKLAHLTAKFGEPGAHLAPQIGNLDPNLR